MSVQLDSRQVSSAMMGNDAASAALFVPFLARDEQIVASKYLGKRGLIIGEKCFIAVTTHRVLNLEIKWGGQLVYQDAVLEALNSSVVFQPSKIFYYLMIIGGLLASVGTLIAGAVAASRVPVDGFYVFLSSFGMSMVFMLGTLIFSRLYYVYVKSGFVFQPAQGIPVYAFCDRSYLGKTIQLLSIIYECRSRRIEYFTKSGQYSVVSGQARPAGVGYGA